MANENEKVGEIVKEIRDSWAQVYFSESSRRKDGEYCDNEFAAIESETVADRIEAAHKREVEKLRDVGKQMLRRWCNLACTCEHCEFNAEPCSRWRKILEGENDGK